MSRSGNRGEVRLGGADKAWKARGHDNLQRKATHLIGTGLVELSDSQFWETVATESIFRVWRNNCVGFLGAPAKSESPKARVVFSSAGAEGSSTVTPVPTTVGLGGRFGRPAAPIALMSATTVAPSLKQPRSFSRTFFSSVVLVGTKTRCSREGYCVNTERPTLLDGQPV